LPIALNAGFYWPQRNLKFRPGKIRMEILEPIPLGLNEHDIRQRLQLTIDDESLDHQWGGAELDKRSL